MSYGEKQMGSPLCPNNPDFRRGDGSYNNLLQRSPKPLNSSLESRLSPRVKVGVELSILKSNSPMARDNKMITGVITEGVPISLLPTGLFHPPLQSQTQNRTPMECLIQITIKGRLVSKLFCFLIVEICV